MGSQRRWRGMAGHRGRRPLGGAWRRCGRRISAERRNGAGAHSPRPQDKPLAVFRPVWPMRSANASAHGSAAMPQWR